MVNYFRPRLVRPCLSDGAPVLETRSAHFLAKYKGMCLLKNYKLLPWVHREVYYLWYVVPENNKIHNIE